MAFGETCEESSEEKTKKRKNKTEVAEMEEGGGDKRQESKGWEKVRMPLSETGEWRFRETRLTFKAVGLRQILQL